LQQNFFEKPSIKRTIFLLTILFYVLHFSLNLMASKLVVFTFIAIAIITAVATFVFEPKDSFLFIFPLAYIEGQGRILLGYNPIARILFDFYLVLLVSRTFIKFRKICDRSVIPTMLFTLINFHFLWFTFLLFNPNGPGPLLSFGAVKYFIFPFLFFYAITQSKIYFSSETVDRLFFIVTIILIFTGVLSTVQLFQGESFMYKISNNYKTLFSHFDDFYGIFFRPWGTSHQPGGMSTYFFLSLPLIFHSTQTKRKNVKGILLSLTIISSIVTLFLCNVRSAMIKYAALMFFSSIMILLYTKNKFNLIRGIILMFLLITPGVLYMGSNQSNLMDKFDFSYNLRRLQELGSIEGVKEQRSGFSSILDGIVNKIDLPLGEGLGISTGMLPGIKAYRNSRIHKGKYYFWSRDNFYYFIFLELGIGALLYILIMVVNSLYLFKMYLYAHRKKNHKLAKLLANVTMLSFLLIIFNWGGVGFSFNPESFFFWFYVGIAYNSYSKFYEEEEGKSLSAA
jgi:hypothetical protein